MFRAVISAFVMLCLAMAADAQQPTLSWFRYYQLSSTSEADLVKTARAALDKLVTDGTVLRWGVLEPVSRVGDPWTHAIYVTVADWKAIGPITTALDAAGPTGAEHAHDAVVRHLLQSATPPVANPKYVLVNYHPVIRGRDADAIALFNEWARPALEKTTAGGKVGPWILSSQTAIFDNRWTFMLWYFMSDTSALDEVSGELIKMGFSQLATFERRVREMSEDDYVAQLLRVVHSVP